MKYTYAYKTSDGGRHEAVIEATSREAVFELLRGRGIRPIKVVAADGSKANGAQVFDEIRANKKGVFLIAFAFSVLVAVLLVTILSRRTPAGPVFEAEQTRRQVIGDAAVVDKGIATGWSEVFPEEGERFFASFAIPGVKAGQRNTTVEELEAALSRSIAAMPGDSMETRQIKAMVEGMKAEARAYVAAGGTLVGYGRRLTERQDAEIAVYERAKTEIDQARKTMKTDEFIVFWEERNDRLRNLGIKLVPLE